MATLRAIEEKMARDLNEGPRKKAGKKRAKKRSTKSGSASKRRTSKKRPAARKTARRDRVVRRPAKRKTARRPAKRKTARRPVKKRKATRVRRDDDLRYTGKLDDDRINVHQWFELRDWSKSLGVTPTRLKALVAKHGVMAADVRRAIASGGRDPAPRGASRRGASKKRRPLARKRASTSRRRPAARGRDRATMTHDQAMADLGYYR